MKSKQLMRMIVIIMVTLLVNVTFIHAASINHNPTVDRKVDGNTVQLNWTTNESTVGKVYFSKEQNFTENTPFASDVLSREEHAVKLVNLLYNTTYFYIIGATNQNDVESTDDNSGNFYSFKTGIGSEEINESVPDYDANATDPLEKNESRTLFINANVPRFYNQDTLAITGTSKDLAKLRLYVNPMPGDVGTPKSQAVTAANADGDFTFPNTRLKAGTNQIYIHAEDKYTGNTLFKQYTLDIDKQAPVVNLEIPKIIPSTDLILNGTVDEDVTLIYEFENGTGDIPIEAGKFSVSLALPEKKTFIVLFFVDRAGNRVRFSEEVTPMPDGPSLSWHNLGDLNPSYVSQVTVRGNATPGALVIIKVNGAVTPLDAWSTSLLDLLKSIPVRFQSGEPYQTRAGEDGSFSIKVELSRSVMSNKSAEYFPSPAREPYNVTHFEESFVAGKAYDNTLELIVVDDLGRYTTSGEFIVTFAKCGYGAYWEIDASIPTPDVVTPELLRRGIAQIGYNFRLKWKGPGKEGLILTPPRVDILRLSEEIKDDYSYNPMELVRDIQVVAGRDYRDVAVLVSLNSWNYTQKDLDELEDLLVKIPLTTEIEFEYERFGRPVRTVQRQCSDVSVLLDIEIPSDAVPEVLLEGSIKLLTEGIDAINDILPYLKTATIVVFVACMATWIWWFTAFVSERMSCSSKDYKFLEKGEVGEVEEQCMEARKGRMEVEEKMQWVCDRVFCPSAPSLEKYVKDTNRKAGGKGNIDAITSSCNKIGTDTISLRNVYETEDHPCAEEYDRKFDSVSVLDNELEMSECLFQTNRMGNPAHESCGSPLFSWFTSPDLCRYREELPDDVVVYRSESDISGRGRGVYSPGGAREPTTDYYGGGRWYRYNKKQNVWEEGDMRPSRLLIEGTTDKYQPGPETFHHTGRTLDPTNDAHKAELERLRLMEVVNLDYILDPTSGIISAFKSVCMPAINGYLTLVRNIMVQIRACFQSILVTGNPNSGLCRAVLTQYICDIIIDAIRCIANRVGAGSGGQAGGEGISGFFESVAGATDDIQNGIISRYGETALYNTMFNERKLLHAACLFAFTGDFDFDFEEALTGVGAVPIASEGFLYPHTRRFITSNPVNNGYATNIYHIGTGLVAGADLNYQLELVCSASSTCNPSEGFANGRCDCINKGEQVWPITTQMGVGFLAAGEIADADVYYPAYEHPYRYDKVRLTWEYKDNDGKIKTEKVEEKISQIGGLPPADCGFDLSSASFRCSYSVGDRGYAAFTQRPRADKERYHLGDTVSLDINIEKRSPKFNPQSEDAEFRDPRNQVPFYLVYRVKDQRGNLVPLGDGKTEAGRLIVEDNMYRIVDIPNLKITENLLLSGIGRRGTIRDVIYPTNPKFDKQPLRLELKAGATGDAYIISDARPQNFGFAILAGKMGGKTCYAIQELAGDPPTEYRQSSYTLSNFALPEDAGKTCKVSSVSMTASQREYITRAGGRMYELGVDNTVSYSGIKVSIDNSKIQKGNLNALGFFFTPEITGDASQTECRDYTDIRPAKWKVELELRYCLDPEEEEKSPSTTRGYGECDASNQVVMYNGVAQQYVRENAIEIPIACSEGEEAKMGDTTCKVNQLVDSDLCYCGGEETGEICGRNILGRNYCWEKGTDSYACIPYEPCPKDEMVQPSNEARTCDCNGIPTAPVTTQMECDWGYYCNEIERTNKFKCSQTQ